MAVLLVSFGAFTAVALTTNLAGPSGQWLRDALQTFLGRGAAIVPVVSFLVAGLLVWNRYAPESRTITEAHDDSATGERNPIELAPARILVGVILLTLALASVLHLTGGSPALDAPTEDLRVAGGTLGALIGGALQSAFGIAGAIILSAAFGVLGILLIPGLPLIVVLRGVGRGLRFVVRRLRALFVLHEDGVDAVVVDDDDDTNDATGVALDLTDAGLTDTGLESGAPNAITPVITVPGNDDAEVGLDAAGLVLVEGDDEHESLADSDVRDVLADLDASDAVNALLADDVLELSDVPVPGASFAPSATPPTGPITTEQLAIDLGPGARRIPWKLPPKNLLARSPQQSVDTKEIEEGGRVLQATLHEFGVDATLTGMTVGPTVTRYELELAPGVKVNRVTGLNHDIAYAMATPDVRILAPIPGRSAIGIEVPNRARQLVTLGDILASKEAAEASHPLSVGLGRDISGKSVMLNLAEMPHLLIAGQTGAGKSSCVNGIITSLLMRTTPDQVRMILVDPKRVELGAYNDLPHLLTQVVTNPKKAANALDWAVREMDMRYDLLSEIGVRDITGYNAAFDRGDLPTRDNPDPISGKGYERLPYIVVIVDELNDLMMVAARDVEASICRIAQMARAVGIHLIIATQRPSVDVITGVIKANIPSRLAFSVSSLADSRVVLDQPGAERLIGKGDMLMLTASSSRAQRIQCGWVDEAVVRKVAAHWKRQSGETLYVAGIADDAPGQAGRGGDERDDGDELLDQAMELVVRSGMGSTSMLQRKLRVGFSRAGRLMDLLERRGVVGPSEGSKARTVLMTVEELEVRSTTE
ncbi:MAG: DNA translocase FtsK 4TM domain-containing protein [Acidimicrobiia bacterium]